MPIPFRRDVEKSTGCGQAATAPGISKGSMTVEGKERSYAVSVGTDYDPGIPQRLVFVFHGSGGDGISFRPHAGLETKRPAKTIFVYPDAIVRHVWGGNYATHWGAEADYPFIDGLLEKIAASMCVDRARVFGFGWSSGGYFANQLACGRENRFRALVATSGGGPYGTCQGNAPVLIVHDVEDSSVPVFESRVSLREWSNRRGCSKKAMDWGHEGCAALAGCSNPSPLIYCETRGWGHGTAPWVAPEALRFFDLF